MGAKHFSFGRLKFVVALTLAAAAMLGCQLGGAPRPTAVPPATVTALPLPTVGPVVTASATVTPVGVALPTATANEATATARIGGWVWHDLCDPGPDGGPSPAVPPPGCVAEIRLSRRVTPSA